MPNPWDVLQTPERGDEMIDATYRAVGRALSMWEGVEECLASGFAFFVASEIHADYESPAVRAYGSIAGFTGRREMLDAAANAYFFQFPNEQALTAYRRLINEAQKLSARRNEIAHGRVIQIPFHGFYLMPATYNSKKNPIAGTRAYAYSSSEITVYTLHFKRVGDEISELFFRIRSDSTPRP
jgi:hypothetical protein